MSVASGELDGFLEDSNSLVLGTENVKSKQWSNCYKLGMPWLWAQEICMLMTEVKWGAWIVHWISLLADVVPCLLFMQKENVTHLGIAAYVLCSGNPLKRGAGVLLLLVASDANVNCLLSAAFGFPMTIKWVSVLNFSVKQCFIGSALLFLPKILAQAKLEAKVSKHWSDTPSDTTVTFLDWFVHNWVADLYQTCWRPIGLRPFFLPSQVLSRS